MRAKEGPTTTIRRRKRITRWDAVRCNGRRMSRDMDSFQALDRLVGVWVPAYRVCGN